MCGAASQRALGRSHSLRNINAPLAYSREPSAPARTPSWGHAQNLANAPSPRALRLRNPEGPDLSASTDPLVRPRVPEACHSGTMLATFMGHIAGRHTHVHTCNHPPHTACTYHTYTITQTRHTSHTMCTPCTHIPHTQNLANSSFPESSPRETEQFPHISFLGPLGGRGQPFQH